MELSPYLHFNGNCAAAFKSYERVLGGRIVMMQTHGETPAKDFVAPDWQDKVMHGSVTLGNQVLMGGDVAPDRYEQPKGFSLSLQINNTADAERIFHELAENGKVVMPLEKTFWAARFGVLVDRFGIPWLINCDGSDQSPET